MIYLTLESLTATVKRNEDKVKEIEAKIDQQKIARLKEAN